MRILVRSSIISRLTGTVCALWLCITGPAWAGDGGANLATLQSFLNGFCNSLGVTCPSLPTITQAALTIGAQFNIGPEAIRFRDKSGYALVSTSPPLASGKSPLDLSTSTPFAFVSSSTATGQASATQLDDDTANAFFFAVTSIGPNAQPDFIHLVYQRLIPAPIGQVVQGQHLAHMSLFLTVLNGGVETVVPTTLDFIANCSGTFANCVPNALAVATGNFSGKGSSALSAGTIGLTATSSFSSPPNSSSPSIATFQVDVPLIVTAATDQLYLPLQQNPPVLTVNPFLPSGFQGPQTGFIPAKSNILGSKTASIGIAPSPAPLCPGNVDCSTKPPQGVFGFCASLPDNNAKLLPAVAAFAAVATSGGTLVSAPIGLGSLVGNSGGILCPGS
jgi:hypothetical protein